MIPAESQKVPNGITECYKRNIRKDVPFFIFIIRVFIVLQAKVLVALIIKKIFD